MHRWLVILCFLPGLLSVHGDEVKAPYDTEKAPIKLLTPQEALKALKLPKGFQATLFAAEPQVRQPISLTTDTRGRLWVAECYTYAESSVNFATDLNDRIIILEDTNGDGQADSQKVFWDKAQRLTSVEVGFGGVWALCAPHLLFIPDRNGDDIPDGPPEVVLEGWNADAVRHNIVNGLRWGPDGWLYGRHGILATSLVGKPGAPAAERVPINCGIWRYHPTRGTFEVVAYGTTNSWGFDYDDHGEMFFINTVIGHLWHTVPGAHCRRMYGVDLNPHTYELLEQTADHFHWDTGEQWHDIRKIGVSPTTDKAGGGHAHSGFMIYLGDNWPANYRNQLFTLNLHGRRINCDRLERHGVGYVGKHEPDLVRSEDPYFRGIELIYGPDGSVFVADWSDVGECHENDGVHRASGRIFKISYGQPKPNTVKDLSLLSDTELVKLQAHTNDWYVRQARRVLQERHAAGKDLSEAVVGLRTLLKAGPVTSRLRALWVLSVIDQAPETLLAGLLGDTEEHVRVWAIRLLGDQKQISPEVQTKLVELARKDASGLVRLYLASALQRLPLDQRWPLALALVQRGEDVDDPQQPLMLWYGIEAAVPSHPDRALEVLRVCKYPTVRRLLTRRLTEDLEERPAPVAQVVQVLLKTSDDQVRKDLLQGMHAALSGIRKAAAPKDWDKATAALQASKDDTVKQLTQEVGLVFGDGRALDQVRQLAFSGTADVAARRAALRTLVDNRVDKLGPELLKLVGDHVLGVEAIRGLAVYPEPQTPVALLSVYERTPPTTRERIIDTLASRAEFAQPLMTALAEGKISRKDISAAQAQQLMNLGNADITASLQKHWGELRATSEEKKQQIAAWKQKLTPEVMKGADLSAGRGLFQQKCAQCHTLYGAGGKIGPDLTGGNRRNLDYLLENLLDPSATVAADFKMSTLALKDGRALSGVIVERLGKTVAVQTPTERIVLPQGDIEEITPQNVSLMPEGLFNGLTDAQVRDLLDYLMGEGQVDLKLTAMP